MTVSKRCLGIVCVALSLAPFAACSKDSKKPAASSSAASAPVASVSSVSAPSTSTTSTTVDAGGPCAAPAPPPGAVNVTQAQADFDGDGAVDTLTVYGASAAAPAEAHVQVETASGNRIDAPITGAAGGPSPPRALGGAEISASAGLPPDGSGAEAFITVGAGASVQLVAVYQLIGCVLTRLAGPAGDTAGAFPIGGTVTHLDGLRCDGSAGGVRLVHLSAESSDGLTYATTEERLGVQDNTFVVENTVTDTIDGSDPRLQAFSELECTGVTSP